nr:MAG TPA: Protein of unknown function (DUF2778) [Caudoviricetes sp.]
MKITIKRIALRDKYTIGKLYIDGVYFCDTLEDAVRDLNKNGVFDNGEQKVYGETAIPYGTYEVTWSYSPRFKRFTPRLLNVNSFSGVLIHAGNSAEHSHGCILVGENKAVGKVINSKATVDKLFPIIEKACKENKVTLTIE